MYDVVLFSCGGSLEMHEDTSASLWLQDQPLSSTGRALTPVEGVCQHNGPVAVGVGPSA